MLRQLALAFLAPSRLRRVAILALVAGLPWPPLASSQPDHALFNITRDPRIVATQIRTALPTLERGYALLASTTDPAQTAVAANLLHDTYRYLRAAQESSETIEKISKFPDPLIGLRNERIWHIRNDLLHCWTNRTYLAEAGPYRGSCLEHLERALKSLRVVVFTLP